MVVSVADLFRIEASSPHHRDRPAVLPAQVIQIRNVVVGLRYEQRHAVLFAKLARLLIRIERARKLIEADVACGHIAENRRNSLWILLRRQPLVRAFIARQCLSKPVLPEMDIAYVDLETGEPPGVALGGKNLARPVARRKSTAVFAHQKQRLDRAAQRPSQFVCQTAFSEQNAGLLMKFNRGSVLALRIQDVRFATQSASQ